MPHLLSVCVVSCMQVTKAFIRLFKMRAHTDQLLFPEMMGMCIIVNTPNLFSYVWTMLSPLVDERTRSKVRMWFLCEYWWKIRIKGTPYAYDFFETFGTVKCRVCLERLARYIYASRLRGRSILG